MNMKFKIQFSVGEVVIATQKYLRNSLTYTYPRNEMFSISRIADFTVKKGEMLLIVSAEIDGPEHYVCEDVMGERHIVSPYEIKHVGLRKKKDERRFMKEYAARKI